MDLSSSVSWRDGMTFDAELDGFKFALDADPRFGGRGAGPQPKGLTLTSLAGCTAMDVIAILKKMKAEPDRFEVSASGDLAEEHPKRFTRIVVRYVFEGEELDEGKLRRAVSLSEERYCGVFPTLRGNVELETVIEVNGQVL